MKESIENSIKNSLENYEMPYNADAWKAMSARLDAVQPVAKPRFKWYIAASAIAVVSACGYFYYTSGDAASKNEKGTEIAQENNTTTITENNSESTIEQKHSNPTFTTDLNDQAIDQDENGSAQTNKSNGGSNANINDVANNGQKVDPKGGDNNPLKSNNGIDNAGNDKINNQGGNTPNEEEFVFQMPAVSTKCENEKMVINNPNKVDLVIIYPNGINWVGKANANTSIQLSSSGTYLVGYFNNQSFVKEGTFEVLAGPSADFDIINVEDKYDENGLPATTVVANGIADNYAWEFDFATAEGKEVIGHFFKQGDHKITLTATGNNGCINKVTKKINVEENYNLMAMNSFVPTDIDPANNTFMPYSLKVRGDAFHMIILDPADGHLIYETNDPSKGWDGIDKQTGAMVRLETAYIWKVTMENPMKGESPEYAGTVTPIARRR